MITDDIELSVEQLKQDVFVSWDLRECENILGWKNFYYVKFDRKSKDYKLGTEVDWADTNLAIKIIDQRKEVGPDPR